MTEDALLEVEGLKKHYPVEQGLFNRQVGTVKAVDGVDFRVQKGETVGIVGESGCGKSTVATTLLQLEEPTAGDVRFQGKSVTQFDESELHSFRRNAQIIFQDPHKSFDPRMSIGESMSEPLRIHGMHERSKRRSVAMDLLERVGLEMSAIDRYPHEFSGGQKQRIALARALTTNPDLLVADEPVSALDVSIQANVLQLMNELQDEFGLGILIISHNMGVVKQVCDRVNVMYLGEVVESAPTEELFSNPKHPYTRALLDSVPKPNPHQEKSNSKLTGDVPDPSNPPAGCRFHTRCPEIIQPEDYNLEQDEWRSIMDLRVRLETHGIDREAVRKYVGLTARASMADISSSDMMDAIRDEFGLPASLSDSTAEDIVRGALEKIIDGNEERAITILSNKFQSPCESEKPTLVADSPEHEVSCYLVDQDDTTRMEQR